MHSNSAIGNEAPKSHDFLPVSDNNRSLWRATSSGNNPGGSDTTEDNAIDGKTGDHSEVFTTQKRANNWLQIDFGSELCVRDVVVLKRDQGAIPITTNIARRWQEVTARIGNVNTPVSTGLTPLTSNTICNTDPGNNDDPVAVICCLTPRVVIMCKKRLLRQKWRGNYSIPIGLNWK